nr:hypothetical transcript [Hymenolepis microstoma]CDS29343.1 hypothetical protein HmN_000867800 [Hymenolepis microstoma]
MSLFTKLEITGSIIIGARPVGRTLTLAPVKYGYQKQRQQSSKVTSDDGDVKQQGLTSSAKVEDTSKSSSSGKGATDSTITKHDASSQPEKAKEEYMNALVLLKKVVFWVNSKFPKVGNQVIMGRQERPSRWDTRHLA